MNCPLSTATMQLATTGGFPAQQQQRAILLRFAVFSRLPIVVLVLLYIYIIRTRDTFTRYEARYRKTKPALCATGLIKATIQRGFLVPCGAVAWAPRASFRGHQFCFTPGDATHLMDGLLDVRVVIGRGSSSRRLGTRQTRWSCMPAQCARS